MNTHPVVSPQEWNEAWEELLVKEKELTRARDALAAQRRPLTYSMGVSLEGYIAAPRGEATGQRPTPCSFDSTNEQTRELGLHLLGRHSTRS